MRPLPKSIQRVVLVGIAAIAVFGCFLVMKPAPKMDLRAEVPKSIMVSIRVKAGEKIAYEKETTDPAVCAAFAELLKRATRISEHKCADLGAIRLEYAHGIEEIQILPGHDPSFYEFRNSKGLYSLPRSDWFDMLARIGMDVTQIPQTEH